MKILVIEDEIVLLETIISYFGKQYQVEFATDLRAAQKKIFNYDYDCIILDIGLPDGTGLDVLQQLKESRRAESVIIISAKDSLDDKIVGLGLGADDYLSKPFHLAELGARIASVIRRSRYHGNSVLEINGLLIDTDARTVLFHDHYIGLTRKEYDLLIFLVVNKNKVISKTTIAEHLSGEQADLLDNLDMVYAHIKNLKKKLTAAGVEDHLKSIYGMGYKFEVL